MNITNIASNRSLELSNTVAMSNARPGAAVLVPLFSSTLFVSAFLLFLIQPMVAKMVLPLLGGSPMVWNTCIVFFQVALFAGYAYAHAATKWLHGQLQVVLHLMLLVLPFAVLPFLIGRESAARAEGTPIAWVLMLLAGSIGLPFFVLATSASILQHWFSRTDHHSAGDPYFLYMSSNIGSFVALATYPALVEPLLSLRDQSRIWTAGYSLFAALVAGCALFAWRGRQLSATQLLASTTSQADIQPLTVRRRALWVALAFIPSSLMLAVTTYLSTDIAAVPLLWILPLGLYLLTFIGAFSSKGRSAQVVARRLFPLLLIPLVLVLCTRVTGGVSLLFPLHVLTFVAAAFLCHARLAELRPSPSYLTEFYLWISFGGMLGGLFNGLAAPLLFSRVFEYPIVLVLACIMLPGVRPRRAQPTVSRRRELVLDLAIPAVIAAMTVVAAKYAAPFAMPHVAMAIPALLAFTVRRRPFRFAMSIGALLVAALAVNSGQAVLHAERTFFGVYRVSQDRKGEYRALAHGTTLHGMQAISGPDHDKPLTYYHRSGPFGQAFAGLSPSRRLENIAVIGLGVGVLGTYAQPGQQWTFYEIDEAVERMARDTRYFDYLERCGDRCRVVIGDARLSLARAPVTDYDLLVLDAFSSDSIPMHLLTSEALALYLKHLRPDGLLLFHISNRHLTLAPIIGRLAEQYSLITVMNFDRRGQDWPASRSESIWVAMARTRDDLGAIGTDRRWSAIEIPNSTPLWTDDFSNILSALQFR